MAPGRQGRALKALAQVLRGRPIDPGEWIPVLALANQLLVSPTVFGAMSRAGTLCMVPEDVRAYLEHIHACNLRRDLILRRQLDEAVAALNAEGLVPLVLKGGVGLFLSDESRLGDRITSDIDLAVDPDRVTEAEAVLCRLGYEPIPRGRGLCRAQDAGCLEVRGWVPMALEAARTHEVRGGRAMISSPAVRARHWILHDMLKEGDLWRGRLDLRHLHDLVGLADDEGLDFGALRRSLPAGPERAAFDVQMATLERLFHIPVLEQTAGWGWPDVHLWRRILATEHRWAGLPVRLAGALWWAGLRLADAGREGAPVSTLPGRIFRSIGRTRQGPKL